MNIPRGVVFYSSSRTTPEFYRLSSCPTGFEYYSSGRWYAGVTASAEERLEGCLHPQQAVDGHIAPEGATHWRYSSSPNIEGVVFLKEICGVVCTCCTWHGEPEWIPIVSSLYSESFEELPLYTITKGKEKEQPVKKLTAKELF